MSMTAAAWKLFRRTTSTQAKYEINHWTGYGNVNLFLSTEFPHPPLLGLTTFPAGKHVGMQSSGKTPKNFPPENWQPPARQNCASMSTAKST